MPNRFVRSLALPVGVEDKKYQRMIRNQYNVENFDSNKVRKILNSYCLENISDPRQKRSINQAMGQSRGVASMHYEVSGQRQGQK